MSVLNPLMKHRGEQREGGRSKGGKGWVEDGVGGVKGDAGWEGGSFLFKLLNFYVFFQLAALFLTIVCITILYLIVHLLIHWQMRLAFKELEHCASTNIEAEKENARQVKHII